MTEEEARKRWCPFARVPGTAVNRVPDGRPHPSALCIGSDCMAWRRTQRSDPNVHIGFCGLAGGVDV